MPVAFFSFTEPDRHTVAKIKGRAVNSKYPYLNFKVKDLLKRWKTEDEATIKQAITKAQFGTSRTIVFVGKYTYRSRWVKHEVEMTLAKKKPVYAIFLKNKGFSRIPKCLSDNKVRVYKWSEIRLQQLATQ